MQATCAHSHISDADFRVRAADKAPPAKKIKTAPAPTGDAPTAANGDDEEEEVEDEEEPEGEDDGEGEFNEEDIEEEADEAAENGNGLPTKASVKATDAPGVAAEGKEVAADGDDEEED